MTMIEVGKELLYLSKNEVAPLGMGPKEMVDLLEKMFLEKNAGRYQMPAKIAIHPYHEEPDDYLHAMPSCIDEFKVAGLKWVSGFNKNPVKHNLPFINGLLILNDPDTGLPLCVMDCVWITAKRTGAVSGLTAKHFARKGADTVGVIGCGVQGRSNLEAIAANVPGIRKAYAYDVFQASAEKYAKEMQELLGIEVIPCTEIQDAVVPADILITAGPTVENSLSYRIQAEWLKSGVLVTSVDADFQFSKEAIESIDKFTTDDQGQFKVFRGSGAIRSINEIPVEMGDILARKAQGRLNDEEKIFACNIGLSLCDMIVAGEIFKKAQELGVGTILPL